MIPKKWKKFLEGLWNSQQGRKEPSSSSQPLIPINSGAQSPLIGQPPVVGQLSSYQSNLPEVKENLYWISFRSPTDDFVGVVITKGTSPGKAASKTIDRLELHSDKATIVMIPLEREVEFEGYQDSLLDYETSKGLLEKLGVQALLS